MAKKTVNITSSLAKTQDGTVQITLTIPFELISQAREETLKEFAKDIEVPGFRKGKAPLEKVEEKIPDNSIIEHSLNRILPKALAKIISQEHLKPAIYPKVELIKADEGKAWQIRAVTCELPQVNLTDYKNVISAALRAKSIWTPGKGEKAKERSREEKEQEIIDILLENIKVEIPKLLIDEEVNARLSRLLERIEKLGLTLDGYLTSVGKTPDSLRAEYESQAKKTIALNLILNAIAQEEKINVKETEVDAAVTAASADPKVAERLNTPEQRRLIRGILARKAALDSLSALL